MDWNTDNDVLAAARATTLKTALLLFFAAFVFHVVGSWSLPLIDRDEPRFAEASREMLERGDWVVPYFNNEYRFDKPPLIYWLQASSYRVLGESDFAARLPSVLAAAFSCVLVYFFGLRMLPERHALAAAVLFGFCLQMFVHGKAAVADMVMVFFYIGSAFTAWFLLFDHARGALVRQSGLWLLLALLLGLGFLTKGPVAWLPVIPLIATAVVLGKRPAFHFGTLAALLLASGIVLLWAWPALARTDGAYFHVGIGKHVVGRSIDVMEGHGISGFLGYLVTLPFFAVTIFASFFPGSIWLVWLVRRVLHRKICSPEHFFLLANFLTVFVVFTLVSTKLPHYTLPGFPFLVLLLLLYWREAGRDLGQIFRWSAGTAIALVILALVLSPVLTRLQPSVQLVRAASHLLEPGMEFASFDYQEPSLVWYFRAHVDGFHKKRKISQIGEYMARKGPRFAIVPTASLADVEGYAPGRFTEFRVKGINFAKGQPVDLTMLVKSSTASREEAGSQNNPQ